MKRLPFLRSFIQKMDERLKDKYDKLTTREDFIKFFFWFDSMASLNKDGDYVSFYIHKERLKKDFNLKTINGKRIWKLDEMIKKSIKSGIIGCTGYSNFYGKKYTRKYFYMIDFIQDVLSDDIQIVFEEADYKEFNENINKNIPTETGLKAQYDLLMSSRFNVDFEKGCHILNEIYTGNMKNKTRTKQQSANGLKTQITRLMHLHDKEIFVNKDQITGRVFTSFSTIKKEIREICTIDGEPLIEVDLKSSQPLLWLNQLMMDYPNSEQVKELYKILTERDIYLHFKELFIWENGSSEFEEWDKDAKALVKRSVKIRDDAKREFMRFLFKAPQGEVPFQKICKVYYPDVYKLTQKLKKKSGNLAVLLQKLEADIFIPIQDEFVERGSLSVHDSLYVKKELKEEAKKRIINQMEATFNK